MPKFATVQIPNYTQYQLTNILRDILDNSGVNRISFSKIHNVDEQIIEEVLEGKVIYKMKHYEVVSSILNKPVEELIGTHTLNNESLLLETDDDQDIKMLINIATELFAEWIKQKRIAKS